MNVHEEESSAPVDDRMVAAQFDDFIGWQKTMLLGTLDILWRLKSVPDAEIEDAMNDRYDEGLFYALRHLPDLPVFQEIRNLVRDLTDLRRDAYLYLTAAPESYEEADCGCRDNGGSFESKEAVLLSIRQRLEKWRYLKPELEAWNGHTEEY